MATRGDRRERILEAAMDAITERGMSALRLEDVGRRAGMTRSHVLYYFHSKELLLIETLRWSEERLAEQRVRDMESLSTARERLRYLIHVYLPTGASEAPWLLWLQVWAATAQDSEAADILISLFDLWAHDLAAIVRAGISRGEFSSVDADGFAAEFLSLLDGLSLHVLHYGPGLDYRRACEIAMQIAAGQLGFDLDEPSDDA